MKNLDFVTHLLILLLITAGFAGLLEESTWLLLAKALTIAVTVFVGGEVILGIIDIKRNKNLKGGKENEIQKK